ncbi:hypothetical protein RQP53_21840 [Paucibacter sp. APW11]|uniref:Uncharacterized protein n=1 Tax=Roseateles aquae TaxID=3077235 RepID=A0ABU3PHK4_9BURK|nr:hypothetical protein [Paucibacter sp. APW11]
MTLFTVQSIAAGVVGVVVISALSLAAALPTQLHRDAIVAVAPVQTDVNAQPLLPAAPAASSVVR